MTRERKNSPERIPPTFGSANANTQLDRQKERCGMTDTKALSNHSNGPVTEIPTDRMNKIERKEQNNNLEKKIKQNRKVKCEHND